MADDGAEREREFQAVSQLIRTLTEQMAAQGIRPAVGIVSIVNLLAAASAAAVEQTGADAADFEEHVVSMFRAVLSEMLANSAAAVGAVVH